MDRRSTMPIIESLQGCPQEPMADLFNRPRCESPDFPLREARQVVAGRGKENERPLPPTRPNSPQIPINIVHPYDRFEGQLPPNYRPRL